MNNERVLAALLAAFAIVPLGARADIEGFVLRLDKVDRDEPIESWVAFEDGADVKYFRCRASATDCTRKSPEKDVAESRKVPRNTWIAEVARTYGLDARVLLNPEASATRIDASVEVLKRQEADKENRTADERAEAGRRLAQLTKKDGYRDRFNQARALTDALKAPMGEDGNLVLEASDKRSYRTLWPFNFDPRAAQSTDTYVRQMDVVTGEVWTALKDKKGPWRDAPATCRAEDVGAVPTKEQIAPASAWLAASPLAEVLKKAAETTKARFWLSTASYQKREPSTSDPRPTATGVETKLYYWFDGLFDFWELDTKSSKGGSEYAETPGDKAYPSITQKTTTVGIIKTYDVVSDPSREDVIAQLAGKTTSYGVLCVKKRSDR